MSSPVKHAPKNSDVIESCTTRINATKNYLTAKTEIPIAGVLQKPAAIIAVYQKSLDTRSALIEARAGLKEALAARDSAEGDRVTTEEGLKGWILQRFGGDSKEAHAFGFQPRKVTEKSAESKAKAVELGKQTRALRGTVSKKEKLKIKATVLVATAPAAPANNPAPTPAAAPAVTVASVQPAAPAGGGAVLNGAAHS